MFLEVGVSRLKIFLKEKRKKESSLELDFQTVEVL